MQQEQQKYYANQQLNSKATFNQNFHYQSSQSSLSSSSVSISSSNGSMPSLNSSNPNLTRSNQDLNYSLIKLFTYPNLNNKTPKERVDVLKLTLEEVNQQKNLIGKQLEEMTRLINNLKSKLSPQDLEDVMNRLEIGDNKMSSYSSFDKMSQLNEITPSKKSKNNFNHLNSPLVEKNKTTETLNGDMDSTILADLSNNHA